MDKTYPPEAWRRLGKVLEQRRGQLGYGFRQRENFLRDRGGPPPSVKMLARLERGERTAYPDSTVTLLESVYGYAPGSFEAILEGRDPVPDPAAAQTGPLRAVTAPRPAVSVPDVPDFGNATDEEIAAWAASTGDEVIAGLWRMPHPDGSGKLLGRSKRIELILAWLGRREHLREEGHRSRAG